MIIDTDKAYLMGLLVGGANIKNGILQIVLPYKKWGNIVENPERAGQIASDIIERSAPIWREAYGMEISYSVNAKSWIIKSNNITEELIKDLKRLNLPLAGEFRAIADISNLSDCLSTELHKQSFITGLVDTVGSLKGSHRRFNEDYQIISIEFKRDNYALVTETVRILEEIDCYPDQILWNHPNQHSGHNRYYKNWKKGFKVRVFINDYVLTKGFMFKAKKIAAESNLKKQKHKRATSKDKLNRVSGRVCLHMDEYSDWLPKEVRGGHFVHFQHIAAHMGLEIPKSFDLEEVLSNFEKYICPFTLLTKGKIEDISDIIKNEQYLSKTDYTSKRVNLPKLIELYKENSNTLVYGNTSNDGFPINFLLQGLAYVIAAKDESKVKGARVLGNFMKYLEKEVQNATVINLEILKPNVGTCLIVKTDSHASLVGYINDDFNKAMIEKREGFKVYLKNPEYKDCIKLN